MRAPVTAIGFGLLVAATSVSVVASEGTPLEFRQVVAEATLIARGHVTAVQPIEVPDRGIESVATLAVDEVLKGQADPFIDFRLPGGQIGRYRYVMAGAPSVAVDETVVVFLKRDAEWNAWRPVGLGEGLYPVHVDPVSGQAVVNPPVVLNFTASAGLVTRGDARRHFVPVRDFEALVNVMVAGAAGLKAGLPR